MSSLEKRHTGQRGSMQGHHKYSDGLSDTSSSGSFMDDTDREVSNLTDRAFRSLCIGEEAIYNDSELSSSPTERHKAFGEETQQKTISHEAFSYSVQQYGEAEVQSEMASTFQHSYVDVTHQEQAFREGSLSYMNNGSKEVTWQQSRSTSRVSSLIKAFSSGECYQDSGTCDVILARDRYRDFGSESWDKSAMLNIQRELSEFSSGYQQNFKSGPFQSYRNHSYTSDVAAAVAQMDTAVLMKSAKSKFKALNSTNCFFHSEFSPFQLWEEYNRFSFQSMNMSGFMSANEFPRWYDSLIYKELKDNHRIPNSPCESRRFNQRQIQDVVASQRSRSTVVQKASAIEKRCESEMASNYPPWKKNNNFVKNKLPGNRPSTVSPTNERKCRPDSNLFSNNKVTHEIVVASNLPSSVTPFNITQLLTPVIHTRQETETSEILQFAHTPSVTDHSSQGETDPKLQTDVKHLRNSYKSKASSLLFNLKDNRRRVKSTYSPTRFEGLEITDRNKQTSKLEGRESRFSDIFVSQETAQENLIGTDARASCNLIREPSVAPITPKDYTDGFGSYDNLTLTSPQIQDRVANYKSLRGSEGGHSPSTDPLANTELSTRNLSAQDKSSLTSEGQLIDLNGTFIPARPEIANVLPKAYLPTHSLPAQTSERYGQSDNANQNDLKQRKDFGRKTFTEYSQNEAVKEKYPWDHTSSVKETDGRSESRPFRGEIAALIEMDKQRKATAKQYFANDSYSVRKETYMQKVNEDIKLGRLAKEEEKEVREDAISPRKTSYSEKSIHDNQLNTYSKSTESYGIPKNSLQNKTSSPMEAYGDLQSFSVKSDFVKGVPEQNSSFNTTATQNTFDQRAHAPLQDYKGQKNEGLYSYQPYRYEPNKQWHMSSSEDRHTKESVWTQKQSEMIEQSGAKSYTIYNTSSSTLHTLQNEFSTNNGAPNPALQVKDSVVPNLDTSNQNNTSLPTKQEDRFSINDILAVRDNEQARRLRDNSFVLAKSENPQNPIKYDTAEKLTITEPVKEQEQQGYKVQDITSPSPGYVRSDFQNTNETNTSTDRKDRTMSKDTDKVTTRVLSYKERGQSKQEILTSKLKAHAQKEISAIKEKGLAKQGILARNSTKTRGTINNDGQERHSVKKEITADKLNHLFQDITYSSVTQYKEQIKLHDDHPKNRSPPSTEIQPIHFEDNQNAVSEKKDENVKCKPLPIERQSNKHPAGDKDMKETLDRRTTVENNVHKNYQPSRISEDKQISMTSSEDINTKESTKQSNEMSPGELMSGHLTAAVKTYRENCTSHNPSALHNENQTIQHDQKENLYGIRQSQYTSSEKAVTKPTDIINEDLHVTSNETTKSNSSLNQNSLLGLEKNTPMVKEANVHLKSKITAAMEQSKNEPIKNSSRITASQLTSSSSDMKFKNGIPPAKRLMEPAKSELTSNLQTSTLNVDPEQLINRTYKHNSGVNSDSKVSSTENTVRIHCGPTNDLASQITREPEILKHFNNDDGQALINKNNVTQENDLAKQQNNTPQVKAVETTSLNQMVESHSKLETDEESLTQIVSAEVKESCQQKELHQDDENTKTLFSFGKKELPRSHQSTSRIKDDAEVVNNSQQKENTTESASSKEEQGFPRPLEITHEKHNPQKSTEKSQEVNPTNYKPQKSAEDALKPNVSPQHEVIIEEDATQKSNTLPVLTQIVESTPDTSNFTILIPSNEEPREEPKIYSICVSSKTETASDDEPVIYTICVSSKCHIDEEQNPVKQEEESSVETEKFVKDESFSIKNKRVENEHDADRQTEVSSNIEEKEDKIGKCESTDKSSITGRIGTSYEDLLAKYGLPVRDHGHLTSKHVQDEREQKEKEETETHLAHKSINHGMNRPLPSKEKCSDTAQTHPDDSREVSDQQASITSQPLKGTESEIKQVKVQHYDTTSIAHSSNMAEKQQSAGISTPKLGHSTRHATLILKDAENVKQDQDTHIEPSRQRRGNDIEVKEKKAEEQVRNADKVQKMKGNILDNLPNSRESPKKTENVSQTAKQHATTDESTRAKMKEVLKAPISSMAKDAVNTKLVESTIPEMTIPQAKKKSQKVEGDDKMFSDTDTFMSQKNKIHGRETFNNKVEKTVHEAKQKDPAMAMKQESVSDKDAQTLQKNVKRDEKGGEKRSQEKLQVEFNMSNEIINRMKMVLKDGAATHVNNYRDKVSSIGEDVCTVVKQDQASFEVPKIHLEDIKVSTEEVSSNKEFMAGHKNQHEVIKKENPKGKKGAAVTELVGEKDFTEQKNLPVKPLTVQNEPKTVNNMKGHIEMARTNIHDVGNEIAPLKKDSPSKLEKIEINPRQGAVGTQDIKVYDNKQPTLNSDKRKKEDPVLSLSGQNDGNLKVHENKSILRGKKERNVEATETDQTITNQYQPETKGSARYEQEHAQLNQQDTRKEGRLSKPEATQRNKKVTRPEISAIADYARLKVISAEDDTKELDIFPKMDFYSSYDQPVLGIHKDLYGNVSDIGGESKRDNISKEKGQNLKQETSQFKKQTEKETLPQKQNHLIPNTVQLKPVSLIASGSQDEAASKGTQPRALTNHKESNTKPTFMEHPNRGERNKIYQSKNPQSVPLQAEGTISRTRQMTHDKTTEKGNLSHYGRQESLANLSSSGTVKAADNQINMASPPGEEMEELQYYTVNALDTEIKPKEAPEPPPPSLKMSQNTDSAEKLEEEKKEDGLFLQSLTDYGKVHATGPRSNSSSPAMGKPIMFRVKDNTIRTSSATKTVKPRFHRSFSEDFRIGSPKEHLTGSEKEDEIHPKESANPPVLHEPAIAAHQLHKLKETLHNNLPSAKYATKQSKRHQRKSQHFEEEETCSVISTMSEDVENCAASLTDVASKSLAFMPKHESYRDTYQRPASACYERPESACYERPESACSDIRPFSRPPVVPPKSEKALRRAQRLTTRRMKKAETPKMAPENQEQLESKSIRNVSGVPSLPSDILSTHQVVQASPPLSQYDIQPNYTPPAHSIVAQPFPVTQRKLLQDPNSGQFFMVDVPLPVKTKTFYDPETGKYVQLNVRQRSQGALTQPASLEMLNTPYMLYRGFLPMAASSLPPLRSSSEMSPPADNQDTLERGGEPSRQNVYLQNSNRDSQQYPDMLYGSQEQIHNPSLYAENSIDNIERHTDIITMSELEDFAMEST